jgi:hypothetical protein
MGVIKLTVIRPMKALWPIGSSKNNYINLEILMFFLSTILRKTKKIEISKLNSLKTDLGFS